MTTLEVPAPDAAAAARAVPVLELVDVHKTYAQGQLEVHALRGVRPVSYTHLDVYKRQAIAIPTTTA